MWEPRKFCKDAVAIFGWEQRDETMEKGDENRSSGMEMRWRRKMRIGAQEWKCDREENREENREEDLRRGF
jgi:hypothetical protein